MTISSLILAAKAIARVIEHKAPGTCTSILKDFRQSIYSSICSKTTG